MKSNAKRVKGKTYYYWGDTGEKRKWYEDFNTWDNYRHSVGNYFEKEEDVIEFPCAFCNEKIYEPHEQEFLPEPSKTSEEKFVQMWEDDEGCLTGLTNKGRVIFDDRSSWKVVKLPDFKTIK